MTHTCAGICDVIDTRRTKVRGVWAIRRRRRCRVCLRRWTTYEIELGEDDWQLRLQYLERELREIILRCECALGAITGPSNDRSEIAVPPIPIGADAPAGRILGSGPAGERCSNCAFWGYYRPNKSGTKRYKTSACLRFKELTGKHGPPIKGENSACKYWRR